MPGPGEETGRPGSDERPQTVTIEGPVEIRIENELLPFVHTILDPQGNPVVAGGTSGGGILADMVVRGQDPAGNRVILRTDAQRIARTREFEPYQAPIITQLTNAWTVMVENATANTVLKVWIELWFYVINGIAEGVDLRMDDGATQWTLVENLQCEYGDPPPRLGPYYLTNGWSIDALCARNNIMRSVAIIEQYGQDAV